MPDEVRPGEQGKALGKGVKPSSTAGHDVRLQKRNRNVASSLPDREKQGKAEADMIERLRLQKIVDSDPRAENAIYPAEVRADVLMRRREGLSARQIARLKGYPSYRTIHDWREGDPTFAEAWEKEYDLYAAEEAEEVLPSLVKPMRAVRGLKGTGKIFALKTQADLTLRIAATRSPAKWGNQTSEDREVIVFETYGGWIPTDTIKGSPGQGAEAEAAAERWKETAREQGIKLLPAPEAKGA